ncbi:hypothetical protein ymoll0001_40600 [Yersinia mollaretii ATCC 43969]|uniref:Uncharacterized protein n=1 Tax=Yersinia mollaretii (strain ATCC 43969 / DSM 18520 / CIP 103324 / CNY 7263 / WAIP 204) TaxID=349967 RepID=A0ABM9Y4H4_YERMW|nr:hypothetical protein ymoll0001_40600 [Yersinia mollaretii ATCC 43969]
MGEEVTHNFLSFLLFKVALGIAYQIGFWLMFDLIGSDQVSVDIGSMFT